MPTLKFTEENGEMEKEEEREGEIVMNEEEMVVVVVVEATLKVGGDGYKFPPLL